MVSVQIDKSSEDKLLLKHPMASSASMARIGNEVALFRFGEKLVDVSSHLPQVSGERNRTMRYAKAVVFFFL